MRIGVFGGTFDPVHLGHLILAEQCREQGQLDQVWFIPAAAPPHKLDRTISAFDRRVEMLQLALAGNPAFQIKELEKDRPGPSYTVDTLAELRRQRADDQFFLLIGSDTLADLPTWREPERILQMVGLIIWLRPGNPPMNADALRTTLRMPAGTNIDMQLADGPLIDISSSYLRSQAAAGRSLRYMVPRAVDVYIQTHRLYTMAGDPSR